MVNTDNTINICLACDDNYAQYAAVVIASVLANAQKDDNPRFFILDGGVLPENKEKILSLKSLKNCDINFIEIDEKLFDDYKNIKTHQYITLPSFYRLKAASLIPDVSKIIYFDCDIVVNSSLKPLFDIDIDGFALAAVRDLNKHMLTINPNYFNTGVLLLNLEYWRKHDTENTLLSFVKEHIDEIKVGDQEILNRVLINETKITDDIWNVQSSNFTNRSSYTDKPAVIHYVSYRKPWSKTSFSYHRNIYFKYQQLTPWKLSDEEYTFRTQGERKRLLFAYFKYRPLFWLRPRFYQALFCTYVKPFLCKNKISVNNIK